MSDRVRMRKVKGDPGRPGMRLGGCRVWGGTVILVNMVDVGSGKDWWDEGSLFSHCEGGGRMRKGC